VGVEITDDATELPRFCHPQRAAYIFGGERTSLSEAILKRCEFVVENPDTLFDQCRHGGPIVLYDRLISLAVILAGQSRPDASPKSPRRTNGRTDDADEGALAKEKGPAASPRWHRTAHATV